MKVLKSLLTIFAVASLAVGFSVNAFAKKHTAAKPSWCCMAAGQVVMEKGKKLCVKSAAAPTATDKKHKKAFKSCEVASGAWETEAPVGKMEKVEPKPQAQPEATPPVQGGEPTEEVPVEK